MTREVNDLIEALQNGTMSLEEVAEEFRQRSWPGRPMPRPTSYLELATAAISDPEPDPPGSFSEVASAYARGKIDRTQYSVLSEAAAEGMRRKAEADGS